MSGKARSACSGTTAASAVPIRRPAARCEDRTRSPLLVHERQQPAQRQHQRQRHQRDRYERERGQPCRRRGERGNAGQQNCRRHADAQAPVIDVLDVLHVVGQPVLVAELPARRAGGRGLRHRREQLRAALDLVEQGGAMAHDTFAIFAERLAQREQPDQRRRNMKVESKRGRSKSGQRHGAEEPDGDAGEQDSGCRGRHGKQNGEPPRRPRAQRSGRRRRPRPLWA